MFIVVIKPNRKLFFYKFNVKYTINIVQLEISEILSWNQIVILIYWARKAVWSKNKKIRIIETKTIKQKYMKRNQ